MSFLVLQMKRIRLLNVPVIRERRRLPLILRKWDKFLLIGLCCFFTLILIPNNDVLHVTLRWRHVSSMTVMSDIQDDQTFDARQKPQYGQLQEYNLVQPQKRDFSRGQSVIIDQLLKHKKDGFFVEIGAGDGETDSVSLFFERERSWDGVLVEKSEEKADILIAKNRRAILWNLNLRLDSTNVSFSASDIRPKDLFRLVNRPSFDLLVVNLPDQEYELIQSIDWTNYTIGVINVVLRLDYPADKYSQLSNYLQSKSYQVYHHLMDVEADKKDVIFSRIWH
ncbi:uncharacterized protein LOC106075121 [Biomphalaria glabrata]|uniref:Uncharacterized protein LOC106075121 n=1 Tax=Biomphalaria glabrata TaxID=6526 RepID=A0A9W2YZ93_BIOGL|nr:uncharacterized protein LOC106075121 [Biomphalaria glabrata]XP_055868026.1 uncharacterized protein LOC106075121 [Biomphalaria glabrata]XP_055868027.1 uncharacterized protein LOC106075121 [Biomphalaria glabrata]XP_055868028.1 uncharacterized protein LOC106075121 [Biomphalaria glabrata]XP_055868029.1 uncharacterized protein LOC106075121 [Biomphalaria glabrata]XP_055868030.1 uncharacterized protein LOC106075121 [Biomphalaria glabrata]XP_055868031.1 uncharacterized protein LOC106075121 [Biomph